MKKILWLALSLAMICSISSCKDDNETEVSDTELARSNKEACEKFMKDKANEAGVMSDPSGLLYSVKVQGEGEKPVPSDTVAISYVGKTYKGQPFVAATDTIALVDLSDGLYIGVRHMRVGSEYTLYIPYYLLFRATKKEYKYKDGEKEKDVVVLPYSATIFDMKLDGIIKAEEK